MRFHHRSKLCKIKKEFMMEIISQSSIIVSIHRIQLSYVMSIIYVTSIIISNIMKIVYGRPMLFLLQDNFHYIVL